MLAGEESVQLFILIVFLSFPLPLCSKLRPHCSAHELMHLPCSCAACEEQLELLKRGSTCHGWQGSMALQKSSAVLSRCSTCTQHASVSLGRRCTDLQHIGPTQYVPIEDLCGSETELSSLLQIQESSTVDDFERLADLDFGLMVWRQNLKRSMSLAASWQVRNAPLAMEMQFLTSWLLLSGNLGD